MTPTNERSYQRIYAAVRRIPKGKVASYGQIARLVGRCTPRMVGYAMAAVSDDSIPWHRVINSQGKISPRRGGDGEHVQRALLEAEGVVFDEKDRVNWDEVRWQPRRRDRR